VVVIPESAELFAYGEDWNYIRRFMVDPVDEDAARRLYETYEQFDIACGEGPLALGREFRRDPSNIAADWSMTIGLRPQHVGTSMVKVHW
jgi:hypothetical protein